MDKQRIQTDKNSSLRHESVGEGNPYQPSPDKLNHKLIKNSKLILLVAREITNQIKPINNKLKK